MNTSNKSRRNWFRLKPGSQGQSINEVRKPTLGHEVAKPFESVAAQRAASQSNELKDIAHPPNYDGMDLNELPPMREAMLVRAQVDELFSDVADFASEIQLMQRAAGRSKRATGENVNTHDQLRWAKTAILSGQITRLQIRYRWNDALWIDTLSADDRVFRLIRIRHPGQV